MLNNKFNRKMNKRKNNILFLSRKESETVNLNNMMLIQVVRLAYKKVTLGFLKINSTVIGSYQSYNAKKPDDNNKQLISLYSNNNDENIPPRLITKYEREHFIINKDIQILVQDVARESVQLGFITPPRISINRGEVVSRIDQEIKQFFIECMH